MNIKFEKVFDLSVDQFKNNWLKYLLYSLVYMLFVILAAFVAIFEIVLIICTIIAFIEGAFVALYLLGIMLVLVPLLIMFSYVSSTAKYIIAESVSGKPLGAVFKSVYTISNISFYLTRVYIYKWIAAFAYIMLLIICAVINVWLFILMMLLLLVPFALIMVYVSSGFMMSLYRGSDVKAEYQKLSAQYTRKQIFKGYFVPCLLSFLAGIILAFFRLIPFIGGIISIVLDSVVGVSITRAMMIASRSDQQPDSEPVDSEVVIKSESTTVVIDPSGAQITSVVKADVEYMWQADPVYWGKSAPVLFPFVGKLKDDRYQAGGEMIEMNQHGFLRDRRFTVASRTANSVTFEYTSTLADFDIYPCDFTVQITYHVMGSKVTTTYNVINNSSYEMPYQIGAHPAFNVESVNDLTAVFKPQSVTQHYFANGLQTKTEQVELGSLDLSYSLINDNLPCYSDFEDHTMMLQKNGEDFLNFDFKSMKYLAIWSPEFKQAKFVCIEPWNGICSRQDQEGYLLENKDGINYLAAESSESCSFSFEIC